MSSQGEDVYATLLLNDLYLPGALVLAHSLRDAGTKKKLAVLFTPDSVSTYALEELQQLYDYVISVERLENKFPANLQFMNRPDLHSTFTKILLWKQTQFRKIVYLDSDMVALRAPDELFDLPHAFSAAPDIGWPDIFNSGLMVLTPNETDYDALLSMAQRETSFDGADQGLLNMYFSDNFNRLSFTYNVTPSVHYQYHPAYQYFKSKIVMVHFIGQNKPWLQGRYAKNGNLSVDEMSKSWWSIYDRHHNIMSQNLEYLEAETDKISGIQEKDQHKSEDISSTNNTAPLYHNDVDIKPEVRSTELGNASTYEKSAGRSAEQSAEQLAAHSSAHSVQRASETVDEKINVYQVATPAEKKSSQYEEFSAWDASKEPPPPDSGPEASNFPTTQYTMSSDPTLFKAPDRYPDPPRDMWYEVPKIPTSQKLSPIFPWEVNAGKPSRVFVEDNEAQIYFQEEPSITEEESPDNESITTTTTMTTMVSSKSSRDKQLHSYSRANVWDGIPEIEKYVGKLQRQHQQQNLGFKKGSDISLRAQNSNLFDFITSAERQVLPVTPAPFRRPNFWGEYKSIGQLPAAKGVPSQEEWDPKVALDHLARHQLEVMTKNLEKPSAPARDVPSRALTFGSEVRSILLSSSKNSLPR